ncbi:MAG: FKBP-type peptidyl-prolyl cis-trans isomerase [Streptomycetaceae bacterium]|nr:FKBP-type peptidyl-prolyl cis-trans isomerase [Streptomycetaceae bacterium]
MRRVVTALVVPLLLLLTAACGGGTTLPAVTAGAKFGEKPTVDKGSGDPPGNLVVKTLTQGNGPAVKKGDFVLVNYLGQLWNSDQPFDNSFDRGQPFPVKVGAGEVIKGWDQGLLGQKAGSRIEMSIPPDLAYGAQGQPPTIPANSTLVFVVDILNSGAAGAAKGAVQPQNDASLPKVGTNTDDKAPSIDVPKTPAPKNLVANYVIEGTGPAVKSSDTVIVQYKGVLWEGGKPFDSSYDRGQPASFALHQVVKGWADGLTGKKVGSRVLIVVPPSLGYKSQGYPPIIPPNATLVFSVDILGTL